MTETPTENERIARRVPEDIATDRNLDLVDEVFAEDAVEHAPFGLEARGIEPNKESLRRYFEAFPDLSV